MVSSMGVIAGARPVGLAPPGRPRAAPPAAVKSGALRQSPSMRPLAPTDDAQAVASRRHDQGSASHSFSQPLPGSSNGSSGAAGNGADAPAARLVPMQYRGPPAASNGAAPSSNGSSGNGATPSYVAAAPAAGPPAGAGSRPTFQRTMMVAGFEEDTPGDELQVGYRYAWAQESYSARRRTLDTWSFVLALRARLWLLEQPWSYPGGLTPEKKAVRARALAVWIRESLLQLGPTFIKLGQLFSTRSDLLAPEFTEELSKLQDRVPAFPADQAEAIVERELGAPVGQLFAAWERAPVAAASLGQVHRATLRSGERVVVKVQRPGLRALFDADLATLARVAAQLDAGDEGSRDFTGIYRECAAILYQEIDYINEGRNADRFRRNFRAQPWVRVPRVHWGATSERVLTLDYAPGVKITDVRGIAAAGLDARGVARRATEAYLIQILRHGFFHADPHPGNIAVDADGALIFYDFGMMGEIVPATRESLLDLFYAVNAKDSDTVVRQLVALGIIVPTADLLSIRRSVAYFVDSLSRQAAQGEAVGVIGEDLFAIALDQPFRFPAAFTFVLRAFATLEGIGKALDPDFKFVQVAAPYAGELLDLQGPRGQPAALLGELGQRAADLGAAAAAMPLRVQRMESTLGLLESGDLKLRVRVLEAERSARRAGVMQAATLQAVAAMGLLNVGTQLALAGRGPAAGAALALAAGCSALVALGFRRVRRLDKFERSIKQGTAYNPND